MRLFLGVDGGQSGTAAVIGDEHGWILGAGHSPAWRHDGALAQAIHAATADAESLESNAAFDAACFGLSGVGSNAAAFEPAIRAIVQVERLRLTHDASIALTGALAGAPGILTIAGTGSIAFGRRSAGSEARTGPARPMDLAEPPVILRAPGGVHPSRVVPANRQSEARAGGWGYVFGDEGGAFDLVRGALRAALRQEEGWGPSTLLRDLLLTETGAADANQLMHRFYTPEFPRERIAAFAPLIDQAAASGDAVAQELLKNAAQSLATIAGVVRRRLFAPHEPAAFSYSGGAFASPVLLARFHMLLELDQANTVAAPRYPPAAGALIEAYRAAGVTCALKQSAQGPHGLRNL